MPIKIDRSNWDLFVRDLEELQKNASKRMSAEVLNRTANGARLFARKEARKKMTLRNRWTEGSIQSTRTPPTRPMGQQFTLVGSRQAYMRKQELGGGLEQKNGVRRMTTSEGSREGPMAKPRKKLAKGIMRARSIKTPPNRRYRGKATKGRNAAIDIKRAKAKGFRFAHVKFPRTRKEGIVDVRFNPVRMVHVFERNKMRVKKRPWLGPSADRAARAMPSLYAKALSRELAKLRTAK